METVLYITGLAIQLVVIAAIAHFAGYLMTEVVDLQIRIKPFDCRPCLTFWLTLLGAVCAAPEWANSFVEVGMTTERGPTIYALVLVGALTGLANFLYVKSKMKIYE